METFLFLLLLAVAAFLFIASRKPDTFSVQRSAVMKVPPDKIFAQLNDLHLWNVWSPWAKKDPAMKLEYSGPRSGVGAAQAWDGNKNVGKGRMEISSSTPPSKISYNLNFEKPMRANNQAEFTLTPEGSDTRVKWVMSGPVSFPAKIMHSLFDMDKMIGKDFEAGLANLRAIVEKS